MKKRDLKFFAYVSVVLCVCILSGFIRSESINGSEGGISLLTTMVATPFVTSEASPAVQSSAPETSSAPRGSASEVTPAVTKTPKPTKTPGSTTSAPLKYNSSEIRGVWLSTVGNLDYPSKQSLTKAQLKEELKSVVKTCANSGINTIFFQVRPASDALYKSDIYPWSAYVSGKQGKAPDGNFDSLKFLIKKASAKNIGVQAWINPYRAAVATHSFSKLAANSPVRKNKSLIKKCSDGNMYFDPGKPKSLEIIVSGIKEIVENYDIQGIHFDDYFYPDVKFNDDATYKKYGKGFKSKAAWRRSNVNKLIKQTRDTVKSVKPNVQFGVSPAGVWANKDNKKLGSDTRGNESFFAHSANTRMWVKKEWIDYIIPQIYWEIGHPQADYKTLVKWWSDVAKTSKTRLYIGLAAYRLSKSSPTKAWRSSNMLKKEIKLNRKYDAVNGSVLFRYKQIADNTLGIRNVVKDYLYKEK